MVVLEVMEELSGAGGMLGRSRDEEDVADA
jgi:hypothetical protein